MTVARILVVGSGGRENALVWALARSPGRPRLWLAPGNGGSTDLPGCSVVPIASDDGEGLLQLCLREAIELVVIGPEAPLAAGLADELRQSGLAVFGPGADGARLEASKHWAKTLMREAGIPTAGFWTVTTREEGVALVQAQGRPLVVKADGLAGGKGVVVAETLEETEAAIEDCFAGRFGSAGRTVVLEERLQGPEVSVFAFTDGEELLLLPPAQDHKRIGEGDTGPNTGGMGAYCPTPFVDASMLADIEARILVPTAHAMRRAKVPFHGVLYAGLMLTAQGPKVLEFNARFGDPECEALMVRLESSLLELLDAAVDRRLDAIEPPRWREGASVTVVMASDGYPGPVQKGRAIRGLDAAAGLPDVQVFHAATRHANGEVQSDGGRVLAVTAVGPTLARAKLQAYTAVKEIRWQGAWCRKDISDKGLTHERENLAAAQRADEMAAAAAGVGDGDATAGVSATEKPS
jgi:phosphoribosylamine--glycine ligase